MSAVAECHKLLITGFYRVGRKPLGIMSRKFLEEAQKFSRDNPIIKKLIRALTFILFIPYQKEKV